MQRISHVGFVMVATWVLIASEAVARVDRATVIGTIRDSSGGVVPGATVTARHVATNVPSSSVTDAQGTYLIGALIPGSYVVEVELVGFQKTNRKVDLDVGQRSRVDFTLAVGAVEQSVTVQASSPIINTEQATLGTVIRTRGTASP